MKNAEDEKLGTAPVTEEKPAKRKYTKRVVDNKEAEAKKATKNASKKSSKDTAVKVVAEPEPKVSVVIEYEGRSTLVKNVIAKATKAYKKANKGVVIKKIDIYIKPEENAAYYVINGDSSPSYRVEL